MCILLPQNTTCIGERIETSRAKAGGDRFLHFSSALRCPKCFMTKKYVVCPFYMLYDVVL